MKMIDTSIWSIPHGYTFYHKNIVYILYRLAIPIRGNDSYEFELRKKKAINSCPNDRVTAYRGIDSKFVHFKMQTIVQIQYPIV